MTQLAPRPWVPTPCETRVRDIARAVADDPITQIEMLSQRNRTIHERECFNLNPAANVMNPRGEALLSTTLGSRPSLGYPGDKYEMGLEAVEEIEVIAAELAARVFDARFAEVRVASGAAANLYAFMAVCQPGDVIIAPPGSIGGHVTHHNAGCAGLYGLTIHEAPVDADGYTIDVTALRDMARALKPKLITVGGSLNLYPHPVADIRTIANEVGAKVLFDAAHQCGMIAGRIWANPLDEGAHLMTMSTYKSLGGPAGGLIVTNEASLAERLDAIAFPGMTANFDAGRVAALGVAMQDWLVCGHDYAQTMVRVAAEMADGLAAAGVPVFTPARGASASHQFALEAAAYGGGQVAAKHLRKAGFLASGIGLPVPEVPGDMNGLRLGTPEAVRWGVEEGRTLAALVARALESDAPEGMAAEVAAYRQTFQTIRFVA
jgi:glycine hydroxymethyltransferase